MHMKDNLVNFLYDREYFITIYNEHIHVFNYKELVSLNSNKIILKLEQFSLTIKGKDLFIKKMLPNEILIMGMIESVNKNYE